MYLGYNRGATVECVEPAASSPPPQKESVATLQMRRHFIYITQGDKPAVKCQLALPLHSAFSVPFLNSKSTFAGKGFY